MTLLTTLLAEWFARHRGLIGLLILLTSAVAAAGFVPQRARPKWDSPSDNRSRSDPAAQSPRFSLGSRECTIVVDGEELFTQQSVRALRAMVAKVDELDFVQRVVWIDQVPVTNAFGLPEPLLPRDGVSVEHFHQARQKALEHPLVGGQLVSPDGKTMLMPVTFDWLQVTSDEDVTARLLEVARQALASAGGSGLRVRLTGNVPLYVEHEQSFDRNHYRFTIIGYVLVLVLAVVMFRGLRAVLILAAAPALGIFWSLGILNLLGEEANPLTNVVLPVLVSMVGLTDGVHLLVHIRRRRAEGMDPIEASKSAIREVGLACALTSITTAIGFASLMLAESEVIQGFGRACAIGVMITFVAVVTSIPLACSSFLGRGLQLGQERDFFGSSVQRFGWWFDLVTRRPRLISVVAVVMTFFFAAICLQLRPDHTIRASQPTGSEAYQALLHCDQAFGGVESIAVVVHWPPQQEWDSPQLVQAITDVEGLLDDEPLLSPPLSLNQILEIFPGDTRLANRLPLMDLLPIELKRMFIDATQREAYVTVRVQDLGIARYEPVFDRVEQGLAGLSSRHSGFEFRMLGQPVERGRNLYQIVVDLAKSLGTAAVIIFAVMAIVYRSLWLGLITIIPNFFPLAVTGAILYLCGRPLDVASACSFTVCLGIAVDDTIHFLTRYQQELHSGQSNASAVRRTITLVGAPMVMTTFVLIVGFATVLTSELPGQRTFAAMACSTIGSALIGDLVFLPALLIYLAPRLAPQPVITSQRDEATTAQAVAPAIASADNDA